MLTILSYSDSLLQVAVLRAMEFAIYRSCFIGADDSYSQIVEGRSFLMPRKGKVMQQVWGTAALWHCLALVAALRKVFIALPEVTEAAS